MPRLIPGTGTTHHFISLSGIPQEFGPTIEQLPTRQGVDGVAFRKSSQVSRPFTLLGTVDLADSPNVIEERMKAYKELVGGTVGIVDDRGENHYRVMVLSCALVKADRVVTPVGGLLADGDGAWLMAVQFGMQKTEVPV